MKLGDIRLTFESTIEWNEQVLQESTNEITISGGIVKIYAGFEPDFTRREVLESLCHVVMTGD